MKLMLLILLVAGSAVARSQTDKALGGGVSASAAKEKKPQPNRTVKASGTNEIRIVNGMPFHVLSSSNWVTLPGPNERASYLRPSNYGPVFKLEKRMETRYRQSTGAGTRVWYEPYQEIAIKNYPDQKLVLEALLPSVRVMLIRTTSEGIAVYDYGTVPNSGASKK